MKKAKTPNKGKDASMLRDLSPVNTKNKVSSKKISPDHYNPNLIHAMRYNNKFYEQDMRRYNNVNVINGENKQIIISKNKDLDNKNGIVNLISKIGKADIFINDSYTSSSKEVIATFGKSDFVNPILAQNEKDKNILLTQSYEKENVQSPNFKKNILIESQESSDKNINIFLLKSKDFNSESGLFREKIDHSSSNKSINSKNNRPNKGNPQYNGNQNNIKNKVPLSLDELNKSNRKNNEKEKACNLSESHTFFEINPTIPEIGRSKDKDLSNISIKNQSLIKESSILKDNFERDLIYNELQNLKNMSSQNSNIIENLKNSSSNVYNNKNGNQSLQNYESVESSNYRTTKGEDSKFLNQNPQKGNSESIEDIHFVFVKYIQKSKKMTNIESEDLENILLKNYSTVVYFDEVDI